MSDKTEAEFLQDYWSKPHEYPRPSVTVDLLTLDPEGAETIEAEVPSAEIVEDYPILAR